ncbi:MAG: M14 family metallopeptidase [Calditrichae bacterium]|nr:M14 family metallopeptidase [Calditrichia bacterium]
MIHFTSFGISPQGRELPLLIIDKNGNTSAEQVRRTANVVLLIQAGIHSGEIDGKDAGLMLIRDMIIRNIDVNLLDHVTILFMPIFNVDGHERSGPYNRINQNGPEEMGWRTTAQNYNLNRDYLKADAPEMKAWLKLYNEWLPEFFIDCHVTNGADYQYVVTFDMDQTGLISDNLLEWTKMDYLQPLKQNMHRLGYPIIEYVSFKEWGNPRSGMSGGPSKPRFSTGYTPLHNRPGLLIETHMLKDYKTRVDGTYHMLKETLKILDGQYLKLKEEIVKADAFTRSPQFREAPYTLTYRELNDSSMIDFNGVKYSVEKSDLSGGDWYRFSEDTLTFKVPFYNSYGPDKTALLPDAYIIPLEWTAIIERLDLHGIEYKRLKENRKITVKTYRFSNVKWKQEPYENHHTLTFDKHHIEEDYVYPAGSVVIPMNQRRSKIIAHLLEPDGPGSLLFWGFFDSIFERKEYAENYVMEEYARLMLTSDENLKKEFETKIHSDSTFAADPNAILDWFYKKSPYWDDRINLYPVGKIYDADVVESLLN